MRPRPWLLICPARFESVRQEFSRGAPQKSPRVWAVEREHDHPRRCELDQDWPKGLSGGREDSEPSRRVEPSPGVPIAQLADDW